MGTCPGQYSTRVTVYRLYKKDECLFSDVSILGTGLLWHNIEHKRWVKHWAQYYQTDIGNGLKTRLYSKLCTQVKSMSRSGMPGWPSDNLFIMTTELVIAGGRQHSTYLHKHTYSNYHLVTLTLVACVTHVVNIKSSHLLTQNLCTSMQRLSFLHSAQ